MPTSMTTVESVGVAEWSGIELAVVVPTYNERENVPVPVAALEKARSLRQTQGRLFVGSRSRLRAIPLPQDDNARHRDVTGDCAGLAFVLPLCGLEALLFSPLNPHTSGEVFHEA